MIPKYWLTEAKQRIAPHIKRTPLTFDPEKQLYIKWENHQVTHSFKDRGALNKVLSLQAWEYERGLVAASAGNHGQGVALAGKIVGAPVKIFVSENAVPNKIEAMRKLDAEITQVAGGYHEAEEAGLAYAARHDVTWISPYNDGQVVAGQATLGMEILEELPQLPLSTWLVPVGGGGLITGIGAAIKDNSNMELQAPKRKLVGVQSEASPFMHAIFFTGSQQNCQEKASLADGLSGSVEEGSLTIPLVKKYVDDFILVNEEEIVEAIRFAWSEYQEKIEGSAAVSLAAALSGKVKARPAIVIISGGNIQNDLHSQIINNPTGYTHHKG